MEAKDSNTKIILSLDKKKEGQMQGYLDAGKSVSISIPPGTQDQFVQKITTDLIASGAPPPRIMHVESPSLESDIREVEDAAMSHLGFPSKFRQTHPEYNIWVNPDAIIETGLPKSFQRVGKYARNILVFDHEYQFDQLPKELRNVLGGQCDADFRFDK